MKKLLISALCAIASISLANAASITPATPSTDEESGCFLISSAEELYGFAEYVNAEKEHRSACAKLTKNITVNEDVFDSTGKLTTDTEDLAVWTPIKNYCGEFDGQGKTISGLYIDAKDSVGLFRDLNPGTEDQPTVVKNVGVVDSYFKGGSFAGSIAGLVRSNAYVTLESVYSNSTVVADTSGGLIGFIKSSTVTISNSYFKGDVDGDDFAAGLVGYAAGSISISNSYTTGSVSSDNTVGALVAHLKSDAKSTIKNTYILDSFKEKNADASAKGAIKATSSEFKNGTVALKLREYKDKSVWGQDVKKSSSPTLSGEIKNATVSNLTFNTYEGDKTEYAPKYIEGVETTLPTPTRTGYTFKGWYESDEFKGDAIEKISKDSKGNLTFYAKWAVVQCTVKLSVNDTTMGSVSGAGKVDCGSKVTIKATAKSGFKFSKWNDDNSTAERSITVKSDTSFKATFKAVSSSSSAKSSSSSAKSSSSKKVSSSSAKSSSSKKVSSSSAKSSSSKKVSSSSAKSSSSKAVSSSSKKSIKDIKLVTIKPETPDTSNGCYQIGTVEELYGFAAIVNGTDGKKKNNSACGELTSSIVVNKNVLDIHDELNLDRDELIPWNPIMDFKGSFDGHSYKIYGLYFNNNEKDSVGFFGVVTGGSEEEPVVIKNFGIKDSYFNGDNFVGGIVGAVVDANVKFTQIFNSATIEGYNYVGGLIGGGVIDTKNDTLASYSMAISNAYNSGTLKSLFTVGGLIGVVGESVSIINAYNYGSFKGSEHEDVLIGYNFVGISVSLLNTFYPDIFNSRYGGEPMDPDDFENGTLLKQLKGFNRKGVEGKAWNKVQGSDLPGFPSLDDEEIADAITTARISSNLNIAIHGLNMQIAGTNSGTKFFIADVQGHAICSGTTSFNGIAVKLPHAGAYIVRVGNEVKSITVK